MKAIKLGKDSSGKKVTICVDNNGLFAVFVEKTSYEGGRDITRMVYTDIRVSREKAEKSYNRKAVKLISFSTKYYPA